MVSQTAEYALRAVVDLAFNSERARTSREISKATHVPVDYLAKVLKNLVRHNLVVSRRGPGGGFALARDGREISIYDVLLAVDPPKRIHVCPLGLKAHAHALCPLHRRLDDVMSQTEQVFRATTIADITAPAQHVSGNGQRDRQVRLTTSISGGLAVPSRTKQRTGRT